MKAAVVVLLILCACIMPFVRASTPTQIAELSGNLAYMPNPPVAGQTEKFVATFRNVGSVAVQVMNLDLVTDWGSTYYFPGVPHIVNPGSNYQFAAIQVPMPVSATGPHTFSQSVWIETSSSSGTWSSASEYHLGSVVIDIANAAT